MKNDLIYRGDLLKRIERQEKKNVETVPLELLRAMVEGVEKADIAKINKANGWVKLPKGSTQSCKFCGAWHPFNFLYCPHCGRKVENV